MCVTERENEKHDTQRRCAPSTQRMRAKSPTRARLAALTDRWSVFARSRKWQGEGAAVIGWRRRIDKTLQSQQERSNGSHAIDSKQRRAACAECNGKCEQRTASGTRVLKQQHRSEATRLAVSEGHCIRAEGSCSAAVTSTASSPSALSDCICIGAWQARGGSQEKNERARSSSSSSRHCLPVMPGVGKFNRCMFLLPFLCICMQLCFARACNATAKVQERRVLRPPPRVVVS